jgi:chaperonin cofactor prefoldin
MINMSEEEKRKEIDRLMKQQEELYKKLEYIKRKLRKLVS